MEPSDFQRFNELMNGMAKTFDREIDRPLLDVYWLALRDWQLEYFEQAVAHLTRTHRFAMPKPGDFQRLLQAGAPTAGEAWRRVLEHCESGAWRRGDSSGDVRVDAAVTMCGGWSAIALCETSKLGFIERRFCDHYAELENVEEIRERLPQIVAQNRRWIGGGMQKLAAAATAGLITKDDAA